MKIDQIHFYVENASQWRNWFVSQMGFQSVASPHRNQNTVMEVVKSGEAVFVLYAAENENSPIADYLQNHPPGVAAVTFHVPQLAQKLSNFLTPDVTLLQPLQKMETEKGCLRWCQILGVTGLIHTLVERQGITPLLPSQPKWVEKSPPETESSSGLFFTGIDHLVLNVARGALTPTVQWYEKVFGWQRKQAFSIETPRSGLHSQVLVDPDGEVQFPINEPSSDNSQIQEFIDYNRGAGIQHLALSTSDVATTTIKLKERGISFLSVPNTYYTQLKERFSELPLTEPEWEKIKQAQVLVDCEAPDLTASVRRNPLLLQIFTKPIFAEPTFFFELIERRDRAQGFGEGNFRALFEAIEREQFDSSL
ncbi:UNVERIFIED_CONTAM: 4-hydroxyphenylpyruvate dioxygenase [Euhalothece sp. KZN 001]